MKRQKKKDPVMLVTNRLVGVPRDTLYVVDPRYPIDYSKVETPPNYKCGKCGATDCKLWRLYQVFLHHQILVCAKCAAKGEKEDITDIDAVGKRQLEGYPVGCRTDQIGNFVPAVPTEENNSYWGYTSVPQAGCDWWRSLPTLPLGK